MTKDLQRPVVVRVCEPWDETSAERAELEEKFRAVLKLPCWSDRGVLTSLEILKILALRRQDRRYWTITRLAAEFGCSLGTIHKVLKRKNIDVKAPTREEYGL